MQFHNGISGPLVVLALGLYAPCAAAYDAEVSATMAAQGYALRSPFGDPVLFRRRVTQTLGLGMYNLLDDERPGGAQITIKLRMRLDADWGLDPSETAFSLTDPTSRYVPGLREAPIDLMYGYVEGRNLLGGHLGFRLGRQYITDALGWWSFDGGLVRAAIPYVHIEGYGGYEQRGGLPLSTSRYEPGGIWRGDRSALLESPDIFPMFQEAFLAPAYGFALESSGPLWIHGRVDYRKVYNRGWILTQPVPTPDGRFRTTTGARTSSERVGLALDGTLEHWGAFQGGVVYDMYNQLFSNLTASVDGYANQHITISGEYDAYHPTFDGDSIWNWFSHSPITTTTARIAWNASDRLDAAASVGARWWQTDENPNMFSSRLPGATPVSNANDQKNAVRTADILASADGRLRWASGHSSVRGVWETGERGRREGVDVAVERDLTGGKYLVTARGSLFDWSDAIRPDRNATSVGYVLGGGWRPSHYANVMLEWEHNTNRLVGQRYRVLALLNLLVTQ